MSFNLADYQPVEERIRQFWEQYPEGRILTDLVEAGESRFIVRAEVYTDRDDLRPAACDYAYEIVSTRGVNSTSALENCATSATGRALANLGFAPKGARPSREEMSKAQQRESGWSDEVYEGNAALVSESTNLDFLRTLYIEANRRGDTAVMEAASARAEAVKDA
jgi:hypothetical protein